MDGLGVDDTDELGVDDGELDTEELGVDDADAEILDDGDDDMELDGVALADDDMELDGVDDTDELGVELAELDGVALGDGVALTLDDGELDGPISSHGSSTTIGNQDSSGCTNTMVFVSTCPAAML